MGIATSLTSDRMLEIEQNSIVGGSIDSSGNLILEAKSGSTVNAGKAKGDTGPKGSTGLQGPPTPDTGFVTGLAVSPSTYWQLNSAIGRKIGGLAVIDVVVTYLTGNPDIVAGSDANIPDQLAWLTMPVGWRLSSSVGIMALSTQSGVASWVCRINSTGGTVDLTHASYPGQVLKGGATIYTHMVYWTN